MKPQAQAQPTAALPNTQTPRGHFPTTPGSASGARTCLKEDLVYQVPDIILACWDPFHRALLGCLPCSLLRIHMDPPQPEAGGPKDQDQLGPRVKLPWLQKLPPFAASGPFFTVLPISCEQHRSQAGSTPTLGGRKGNQAWVSLSL